MTVIAAGELDDDVPAGRRARETERAHRRLRAGADEPDLLDRRHGVHERSRELDLTGRRRPEAGPVAGALALPTLRPLLGVAVAAAPVRAPVPTVTLHRLDPAPAPVVAAVPATAPHESTWTVARGDSFWSMAEQTLGHAWKRAPTAAEVVPYWSRLVDANRSRLADPARPDLIFAGQVFVVLPPPTRNTDH